MTMDSDGTRTTTFFITGVSGGIGRGIAQAALDAGHAVIGTVRSDADAVAFEALGPRAGARLLDVTNEDAVLATIDRVESEHGPIDVLVVNAGYGHEGILEETTMEDVRRQFEVNVFGAVATIKAVLPHMRARRDGHIFTITSMGGLRTFPALSLYHGSKYALEGISESLAREVEHLGIHVTAVAPGGFRTDWAGRSMVRSPSTIDDYEPILAPAREARHQGSGRQLGNPLKAGEALLTVLQDPNPPRHLLLGSDALRLVAEGRQEVQADIDRFAQLSRSTDFADGYQMAT
jgi:NAD(P)-dependent dehydrogenase (short-subunit alcohol dehydrogenase family)